MKKLFLSLVAVLIGATTAQAQSSLLATLSHDGEVTAFYGANALRDAEAAAAHGDVITLSSGTFNATTITKAITLRGAGMQLNESTQIEPTVINQLTFSISVPEGYSTVIEGLDLRGYTYVESILTNPKFIKCRIEHFGNDRLSDPTFVHCKLLDGYRNGTYINSVVWNLPYYAENCQFDNCVISADTWKTNNIDGITKCLFRNCILIRTNNSYNSYGLVASNSAYNCVAIYSSLYQNQASYYMFNSITNSTNKEFVSNGPGLFATFTGTAFSDEDTYELTDEAASTYLGLDGTQVGIYGGSMPFDPTPTNPQITKANVAAKSTADGKLSVDIEVKAAE